MITTELVQRLAVALFCLRSTYILCGKCESNNCLSIRVSTRSTVHCVFINRRTELTLQRMPKTLASIIMLPLIFFTCISKKFLSYGMKHRNFRQSFRFLFGIFKLISLNICHRVCLIRFQGADSLEKLQEEN